MPTHNEILIIAVAVLVLLMVVALAGRRRLSAELEQHIRAIPRLEAKLDLLLKQGGVRYEPHKTLSPAIVDAIRRGSKIEAIKLYREATGLGLKEAKDYIEDLMRRGGV
jgi:ribosomal protein L7/L12